ncbi:hypothetical protein Nepgr_022036 [Nepenthes gracilis]|uniref:Uncharacterized protein n=1 Tax=Nepenthes gracilis TaxID=150966 RepID=A0AAD3SYN5_NEPGR|nr:hypothetical protein Nepgr_022036 [Nepenthes gracilis]
MSPARYFSPRSAILMVAFTISLILLPLVLPDSPLLPPPLFLLFVPVVLLALLFLLALFPGHLPDPACCYV